LAKVTRLSSTEIKKRTIKIWNEVAPRYHHDWASRSIGPFKSTSKLLGLANIKRDSRVLDLACGTGIVTRMLSSKIGPQGLVVGVDISSGPLKIAKRWSSGRKNMEFVNSDIEKLSFKEKFDSVTCQYGLMFLPHPQTALQNIRKILKNGGTIAVAVHGDKNSVPYFSCVRDAILKFVPDFIPPGTPNFDRFGTKDSLKKEFAKAGYKKIKIHEFNFSYKAGRFEDYWNDYFAYMAKPLKEKLKPLTTTQRKAMKEISSKCAQKYVKKGKVIFPWKVLILSANK
jgi:ubiquinone/menaquinone biosynthesis C-methylase UbiE